jgi:hypothetical protein
LVKVVARDRVEGVGLHDPTSLSVENVVPDDRTASTSKPSNEHDEPVRSTSGFPL